MLCQTIADYIICMIFLDSYSLYTVLTYIVIYPIVLDSALQTQLKIKI